MQRIFFFGISLLLAGGIIFGLTFSLRVSASVDEFTKNADKKNITESENPLLRRAENIALIRGIGKNSPFNPQNRIDAIRQLERAERSRTLAPQTAWTEIGPAPIPLGETDTNRVSVSGRVTAIAIHPANPNIVYAGTAQGGVYRTTNGGANWTPLMDGAQSLAIGAIAISASQPETIYVGTGEPNFAPDAFFGVGVYRIDNASTTATLSGPLGGAQFAGRAVSKIIVHPANPATIFVSTTSGVGGFYQSSATLAALPKLGVYRSTDATSGAPTFTQIGVLPAPDDNTSVRDIAIDPANPNVMVANLVKQNGGIYRTINALAATPSWTSAVSFTNAGISQQTAEFASHHANIAADATFYAAVGFDPTVTGGNGGRVLRSIDGGATWTEREDNNFCGSQCFYNIAIAVSPTNPNPDNDRVYIGGQTNPIFAVSTDGADTFANSQANLHSDSHVIAVAPADASIIYTGNDGGIFKSTDAGATWTSLNNAQFGAAQFISLDVHPTDVNFTIGGTQDNGTNLRNGAGAWSHADDGDGGFSLIDQNATDTTSVTMFHTYSNSTTAMGYARVSNTGLAMPGTWTRHGCGVLGYLPNGMTCAATAILYYAPMERGPGNPNTIYFGSDVLYRSSDSGLTMSKASQEPIGAISAIGISRQNDNVRIVGTAIGGIYGTGAGATVLNNLDPGGAVPDNFIARAVVDPLDQNTAYVTISAYNVVNVWKTTTLNSFGKSATVVPTWLPAAGTGAGALPQVPVNALVIDPSDTNRLYAGTDIGVYTSADAGANWIPFGTGLPRVAVFDMAITPGTNAARRVRIATHGRGLWEIPALVPSAANVSLSGRVTANGAGVARVNITIIDARGNSRRAITNGFGYYRFDEIAVGQNYIVQAVSKRYTFAPQVVFIENDTNVDFAPLDSGGIIKRR